ncbi:MAG: FAD-dependent oxidoreductase [Candidatus Omnitrophota bacterium]|nr:MAG: FAD-dependent oxidoreductase [Candidatus Omnitrophota bacterium]
MKSFKAELVARIKRTHRVESFRFVSNRIIDFIPGQFLRLIFDEGNEQNKALNKYLSFSASPTKQYIEVTKKLGDSPFSQRLRDLNIGDKVLFQAPLGQCVFDAKYRSIVFLIGGIGITPVISIIEYVVDSRLDTQIELFYANSTEADIAFRKELDCWQSRNSNIKVFYIVSDWEGEDERYIRGVIDKNLIRQNVKDLKDKVFFIFGPPAMVESMKNLSVELGCSKDKIKTESFIGY